MSENDLKNTVALVTGATGGIGAATCKALAEAGATVIATDIMDDANVEGAAEYHSLNVCEEEAWKKVVSLIEKKHGRLDILVNNAGISVTNSIAKTSLEEWRKCQSINVEGLFLGTKISADLLAKSGADRKGGSSIVNLSSVGGLKGAPYMSAYCSSKGAVTLFTKSAAAEYALLKQPIRVNSVHPGGIDTGMMSEIYQRYIDEGLFPDLETAISIVSANHALGRMGDAEEVAAGILFLCTPGASFMTGSELVIDGGMTAT